MRISDWSSDVCSSDLQGGAVHRDRLAARRARGRRAVARRSSAGSLKDMLLAFGRQLLDISLSPALVGVYRIAATEYARFPDLVRQFYELGPGLASRTLDRKSTRLNSSH